MCVLWIVSSFAGRSQAIDTLCFPVSQVQKVLIDAKQKRLADSLNVILRSDISILQRQIGVYQAKDSMSQEVNRTYQSMVSTMTQQRGILEGQIGKLEKDLSKANRRTKWAAFGGLALSGIVTFLFLTK